MNFERSLNNLLYNIFSGKNFNFIFALLLFLILAIIFFNNNNLIEGNGIMDETIDSTNEAINKINETMSDTNTNINKNNKKGIQIRNESFVENMNCSNNHGATDSKLSGLLNQACLANKRNKQQHRKSKQ
tara:strand:- start:2335 stop:2724 length:390 start_codon:yes stop_codon:yes gene_type:complete